MGRKLSVEHKNKISRGGVGKKLGGWKLNSEVRARMGAVRRGIKRPQHVVDAIRKAHIGKTVSEATRMKRRLAKLGKPWSIARRKAQENRMKEKSL